jgi:hypothetical protein
MFFTNFASANNTSTTVGLKKTVAFNPWKFCPKDYNCSAQPVGDGTYLIYGHHKKTLSKFMGRMNQNKFIWKNNNALWFQSHEVFIDSKRKVFYGFGGVGNKDHNQYLVAFSFDGKLKWKYPVQLSATSLYITEDGIIFSNPGYVTDKIKHGMTIKLDLNGKKMWEYHHPRQATGSLAYQDGTTYQFSYGVGLVALDEKGKEKWIHPMNVSISNPVVSDDSIFILKEKSLVALNFDGTVKWEKPYNDAGYSSLFLGKDNTVIVLTNKPIGHSEKSNITLFGVKNGNTVWRLSFPNGDSFSNINPVIDQNGMLYFVHLHSKFVKNELYVINSLNGKVMFRHTSPKVSRIWSHTSLNNRVVADGTKMFTRVDSRTKKPIYTQEVKDYILYYLDIPIKY